MGTVSWTDEEVAYIRDNAKTMTVAELMIGIKPLSAKVGAERGYPAIQKKLRSIGIKLKHVNTVVWTPEKKAIVKKHYGKKTLAQIAELCGVSEHAVCMQANKMGMSSKKGRPCRKMIQETPWASRLLDIYPVAEWFADNGYEVETRTKDGALMAIFRRETPDYTDKPMALYARLEKEGKLSGRFDITVFEPDKPPHLMGYRGFNAMKVGQSMNYEY